jgi:acetolactate synthase-1/2/3 large subunit
MTDQDRNGADALVSALADNGVSVCFANPGTSELDIVLALDREPRIRAIAVAQEGVASGAADGYARMTGRPAATLLHLAPGYHNAAANFHNAKRAHSPIVSIIGDHAFAHRKFDTPLTAHLERIAAEQAVLVETVTSPDDAARAGALAVSESIARGGQVAIVMCADAAWGKTNTLPERRRPTRGQTDDGLVEAAARAIRQAKNPAILIGATALHGAGLDAAARLASAGYRIIGEGFPARQSRGAGRFNPPKILYFTEMSIAQLAGVDLLVLVGAPPPVSFFQYPNRPVRGAPADCTVIDAGGAAAQAGERLVALAELLGARAKAAPTGEPARASAPEGALTPAALGQILALRMPEGAIVSDDGVTASHFAFAATAQAAPHDWLSLTGGALGQGGPVAIGAALAAPDRKVVCLVGDGAFLYTPQSLWTMAREKLDIAVIVAVNRSYEILKIELGRMGAVNPGAASRSLLSLADPDISYTALAHSFGVEAVSVDTSAGFDAALRAAFSTRGPMLVEAILG